jgi:hypothetical protein
VVLDGKLRVEHATGALDVPAGQAIIAHRGEWVRYSSPEPAAPSILLCAYRHSPRPPFTGIVIRST